MPVRVVGRQPKFNGRSVFEIALNLKNFGVGRLVTRSAFFRYPEPTYYKIVKVALGADGDNASPGTVMAEFVFRGTNFGVLPLLSANKSDFNLIHKEDEAAFCNKPFQPLPEKILPRTMPFPPLLQAMVVEEMKARGEDVSQVPQLPCVYKQHVFTRYRVADVNETPTVSFQKHAISHLYEDVLEKSK